MKEKRVEPRICTAFTARCAELPEKKNIFYTAIRDLSTNGIQILYDKQIPCGTNFKVNINLINETAEANAQVAWNDKLPNSVNYCIGLKFINVKEKHKCKIEDFIDTIFLDTIYYSCDFSECLQKKFK